MGVRKRLKGLLIFAFIGSIFTSCAHSARETRSLDKSPNHVNPSRSVSTAEADVYGADANKTGQPIGGGEGYTGGIERKDSQIKFTVSTSAELVKALSLAQAGEIIWIEGDSDIDMTRRSLMVKGGVTIASDRGSDGSLGGRIYQTTGGARLFTVNGENVRLTGLRIEGPHKETDSVSDTSVALYCSYRNLEIDNCEFFGWSDAAIGIAGTGITSNVRSDKTLGKEEFTKKMDNDDAGNIGECTDYNPVGKDANIADVDPKDSAADTKITDTGISDLEMKAGAYIHHNYIHHNQMEGLGYGITLSKGGVALVEANYFDNCRHAIAGTGAPGEGYEARYNICGPNWISTSPHNFDMHGFKTGYGIIAGDTIRIHHNTFMGNTEEMPTCIAIRGVPSNGAYIFNNWFYFTKDVPVWQTGGTEQVYSENNIIGVERELVEIGQIRYY